MQTVLWTRLDDFTKIDICVTNATVAFLMAVVVYLDNRIGRFRSQFQDQEEQFQDQEEQLRRVTEKLLIAYLLYAGRTYAGHTGNCVGSGDKGLQDK